MSDNYQNEVIEAVKAVEATEFYAAICAGCGCQILFSLDAHYKALDEFKIDFPGADFKTKSCPVCHNCYGVYGDNSKRTYNWRNKKG